MSKLFVAFTDAPGALSQRKLLYQYNAKVLCSKNKAGDLSVPSKQDGVM